MNQRLRAWWLWVRRHAVAAVAAVITFLVALFGTCTTAVNQQDQPVALATMVSPDAHEDLIVWGDHVERKPVKIDKDGHGALPRWEGSCPVLPGRVCLAPDMGWNPPYVPAVANGSRPLRFCANDVRAYDQSHGTQITALMIGGMREMWDQVFTGVSSVEDCGNPDIIFGSYAECGPGVTTPRCLGPNGQPDPAKAGCSSMDAWGCSNFDGRVCHDTFNGTKREQGGMTDDAIKFSIVFHEGKHCFSLGHTGSYGGEGGCHKHNGVCAHSDMGYVGAGGRPVDNPTGHVAIEDYEDGAGGYRYNLQRGTPTPAPTPTPTPTPTPHPEPTAPPTPPPGSCHLDNWHPRPGGGYDYLGGSDMPCGPGRQITVISRGNSWLAQLDWVMPATAGTSDLSPAGQAPVEPR